MSEEDLSQSDAVARTKRDLGLDQHLDYLAERRSIFEAFFDFGTGRGLEIGPLDASISQPDVHDVRYVDVFDTEGTRRKYQDDPNVLIELVPEIHFPLIEVEGGPVRALKEAAAPGAPYDWTIASHVIEHVGDVIGWLSEVAELTVDGGALVLAVPDRRYCFDRHRPQTTVGQMMQAHADGDTRPSIRAVYDATSAALNVDPWDLHAGNRPPGRAERTASPEDVELALAHYRRGDYIDVHAWTFTPQSFLEQIKELRGLGRCDWYVETLLDTATNTVEFYAVLRRIPRDASAPIELAAEPELLSDLPDWLDDEWTTRDRARKLDADIAERNDHIVRLEGRINRLEKAASERKRKLTALRQSNRRLRHRIRAMESSVRMRIGSAVVAPFSFARRQLKALVHR